MDSGYNDQMEFLTMYSKMDPSVRELLGHSAEEMIFSCSYMGTKCSSKDFATVHSNSYGNCFSFNSAIIASEDKSSGKRKTSLVGKKFGLSLKLNVDRKEYLGSILSPQSGARIILHHPKSYPLIDQEGIDLSPAFATSVAVKQFLLNFS
ncbi:epithelial sodium channel subunit gamma-like [Oratosquilla oratoria]|uniref:epithelial sodium channel subunit gamma-like n=1 Tax=Oratosquilla oratoria TaxID=337810 RepID=UPI003F76DA36